MAQDPEKEKEKKKQIEKEEREHLIKIVARFCYEEFEIDTAIPVPPEIIGMIADYAAKDKNKEEAAEKSLLRGLKKFGLKEDKLEWLRKKRGKGVSWIDYMKSKQYQQDMEELNKLG